MWLWRFEFIIIDGASKDDTMEVIHRYREHIHHLVSEKDEGLYDAMNKGLKMATGDYVFFLNADDEFYAADTVEKIFQSKTDVDTYYGETMFMNNKGEEMGLRSKVTTQEVPEQLSWKSLRYGMVVSHQAFIIRRSLSVEYDTRYKLAADVDWMIRSLKNCKEICNTHLIFSKFRAGGKSKQQQKKGWMERYNVLNRQYGWLPNFFNHGVIVARYVFSKKRY